MIYGQQQISPLLLGASSDVHVQFAFPTFNFFSTKAYLLLEEVCPYGESARGLEATETPLLHRDLRREQVSGADLQFGGVKVNSSGWRGGGERRNFIPLNPLGDMLPSAALWPKTALLSKPFL